ncbi:NADPH-dependent F420 reductase [Robbsia andropogonis]|uniref:NADPH-dependent F420 reductase n=1 Tax=Robbsia andropogonis TaxID=28092 RepID=UPI0021B2BCD9|nr:NAD(P)-binding domain-containing protein [Robbsia andropogonis]
MMNIGILGAGKMAQMLVPKLVSGGHRVIISNSRGPASLQTLVEQLGPGVRAADAKQMLADADVVILATPWEKTSAAVAAAGAWTGKIVIDTTNNRRGPRPEDLIDIGGRGSSEVVAEKLPGAHVVKTFNYEPIPVFAAGLPPEGDSGAIFFSGDDAQAKATVAQLIRDIGGEPIDAGSLADGGKLHGMGGPLSLKMRLLAPKEAQALLNTARHGDK